MHTLLMPPADHASGHPVSSSAELALMLLGPSEAMSRLWGQIRRLAPYARTVSLAGPANCGQEAVARLLLDLSCMPQRPFLVLQDTEAEERLSRMNAVHTLPDEFFLYLPEVSRLSPAAQHSLLRLLRLRRSRVCSITVSSSEDLRALVADGRFSAQLAEALSGVRLELPALAERVEDLPMLLNQMLALRAQKAGQGHIQLSEDLLRAAMQHTWPGNLVELGRVADRLLATYQPGRELSVSDFHRALATVQIDPPAAPAVRMVKLDTVIHEHIRSVLRGCRGNKLRAAEVLGISRSTLYRMLETAGESPSLSLAS